MIYFFIIEIRNFIVRENLVKIQREIVSVCIMRFIYLIKKIKYLIKKAVELDY